MFGKIKAYVVSYVRNLKNEWIRLDKAMQWWLRFVAIVVLSFLVIVTRYIINYHNDVKDLSLNYEYCYAFVFKDGYIGKANYLIYITYEIGDNTFEKDLLPKAHVGDTILIMYNPDKPSFCLPVEYNKNKYVTKQMIDSQMYKIDPRLIR